MHKDRVLASSLPHTEDHSQRLAEVQLSFYGQALQVLHCSGGREITIGEEGCDFFVPASVLGCASRPLLRFSSYGFSFCFTAEAQGCVQLYEGPELSLASSLEVSKAKPLTGAQGLFALSSSAFEWARLLLPNGMQFTVRVAAAAKRPSQRGRWDLPLAAYTAGSFLFCALLVALIFSIDPEARSLSLSSFESKNFMAPTKIAGIGEPKDPGLTEPDSLFGKDLPKGVKGNSRGEDEGAQGKKSAPAKLQKFALSGEAKEITLSENKIDEFSSGVGVLGLFSGKPKDSSPFASVFGDQAIGRDQEDILGGLLGSRGESEGGYGEGLSGTGISGGRGEAAMGVGKLDDVETYGRGSGLGWGGGAMPQRTAGAPQVIDGKVDIKGSLDKDIIRRVIRRAMPGVTFCYERALLGDVALGGKLKVHFFIAPNGTVISAEAAEGLGADLDACVIAKISQLAFPAPLNGGVVEVSYPFVFQSVQQ